MRWIPNALTMGNVFFGCMAITLVPGMDLQGITLWMTASLICDALDGWASRKLGVEGEMGLQLDSLADAITFGLLPSLMAYQILLDLS
ncbi:MAG: CDP-alcohol phosphatidyltransferase family protein, partial [Schleiferiaceae bacterium]|nr:CDP-alcohol phosphatidyltransferase family protein [Schleiferiaceae bacterium]